MHDRPDDANFYRGASLAMLLSAPVWLLLIALVYAAVVLLPGWAWFALLACAALTVMWAADRARRAA